MLGRFGKLFLYSLTDLRAIAMMLTGCMFFAFAGPFGSFSDLSATWRMMFWVQVFLGAYLIKALTYSLVMLVFRDRAVIETRVIDFIIFSGLFTPVLFAFLNAGPVTWREADVSFVRLFSWVFLTCGTFAAVLSLIDPNPEFADFRGKRTQGVQAHQPRLLGRLAVNSDDVTVTRLTVNDHYVIVGLSDGSEERLLMRLSDAIAEMDHVVGYTTHRSHWVSQAHVHGVVYDGKREMFELTTGVLVPISRTYRAALIKAGLLSK